MKTVIFLVRILVLILFPIVSLNAVNVHFKGRIIANGNNVSPDSVKIVNETQKKTYVMKKFYDFNLTTFSPVDATEYNYTYPDLITKLTADAFYLYCNENTTVDINLTDLTGSVLFSEKHQIRAGENQIKYDGWKLQSGIYIMNLRSPEHNRSIKVIKINDYFYQNEIVPTFFFCEVVYPYISEIGDVFSFYGYRKNSVDSINKIQVQNDTTITFNFIDSFIFSKAVFELSGLNVLVDNRETDYDPVTGSGTTYSSIDTTVISFKDTITNYLQSYQLENMMSYYGCKPCSDIKSTNDKLVFCEEQLHTNYDYPNNYGSWLCSTIKFTCTIDTVNNLMKSLNIDYCYQINPLSTPGNKVVSSRNISFLNLPISKNNSGFISCYLDKNAISTIIKKDIYKYEYHDTRLSLGGRTNSVSSETVIEILGFTPDASLKLTLTP